MPKCKKIDPNCIWIIPPEWHGFNIYFALLNKVYWNYATDIFASLCHRDFTYNLQTGCQSQIQYPNSLRLKSHGQPLRTLVPPFPQLS